MPNSFRIDFLSFKEGHESILTLKKKSYRSLDSPPDQPCQAQKLSNLKVKIVLRELLGGWAPRFRTQAVHQTQINEKSSEPKSQTKHMTPTKNAGRWNLQRDGPKTTPHGATTAKTAGAIEVRGAKRRQKPIRISRRVNDPPVSRADPRIRVDTRKLANQRAASEPTAKQQTIARPVSQLLANMPTSNHCPTFSQ